MSIALQPGGSALYTSQNLMFNVRIFSWEFPPRRRRQLGGTQLECPEKYFLVFLTSDECKLSSGALIVRTILFLT